MNRDRDPTQVLAPATPVSHSAPPPPSSSSTTTSAAVDDPTAGLSKIKATALLLKQKVAGTNTKSQKPPNKISHPWTLAPSSRSSSFSSSTSPYTSSSATKPFGSKSTTSLNNPYGGANGSSAGSIGSSGGIKAMIAAREDPSLSCNKMAPPGTQPAPTAQKREARGASAAAGGMTKVQLSSPQSTPTASPSQPLDSSSPSTQPQRSTDGEPTQASPSSTASTDIDSSAGKRSTRRRNGGGESLMPSQFAASSPSSLTTPAFMLAFQDSEASGSAAIASAAADVPDSEIAVSSRPAITSTVSTPAYVDGSSGNLVSAHTDTRSTKDNSNIQCTPNPLETKTTAESTSLAGLTITTTATTTKATTTSPTPTTATTTAALPPLMPTTPPLPSSTATATKVSSILKKPTPSVFEQRPPSSPRRHTTSDSSSSSEALFAARLFGSSTPPVPPLPQPMSLVNPTLRQLQTPQIPTNLVQARIMQREEKRRRDEELAKIPITANLRTVKKIQAVLVDDGDDEPVRQGAQDMSSDASGTATEHSSISSSSLSPPSSTASLGGSRPRSKTTTSSTVTVSVLTGGKQRGDRNHVEPVAIPKKLAEQVEHILGRKLAGKGSVLDEREQEREEEEARKAAEPLPPIVRGQPRKRALTSAHIRNLVSSWDHKVEEAKEITSEAEQIRQFLEERSAAHAELPKFSKVQLSGSELLKPLPSLPPPPPSSALGQKQKKSVPQRVDGHAKSASSASPYMSGHSAGSSSSLSSSSSTSVASTSLPPVKAISSEGEAQAQDATADAPVILVEDDKMASTTTTTTSSEDKAATEDGSQGQESKLLSKPALSAEMLDTKRSGEVLNNRAVMSRPRRAGARKPASTPATAQE